MKEHGIMDPTSYLIIRFGFVEALVLFSLTRMWKLLLMVCL